MESDFLRYAGSAGDGLFTETLVAFAFFERCFGMTPYGCGWAAAIPAIRCRRSAEDRLGIDRGLAEVSRVGTGETCT